MKKMLAWCRQWEALLFVVFTLLGWIFDFVGLVLAKESSMPLLLQLQLPEGLSPWLSAVATLIVGWLFVILGRWTFWPAIVGSQRRRLYNLLPEVEWCLNAVKENYKHQASAAGAISNALPRQLGRALQFTKLESRLGRLCSKLDGLDVPVPDPVRINSPGELSNMADYLTRLQDCVSACDLDAAREIDPS